MGDGPKFALSWRGGSALTRAKLRSVPMHLLVTLLRIPGAHFVSLQYGDVQDDLEALRERYGVELPHFPEVIPDYDEAAALVTALDGVITVCTSLVHLAGALGRPAHVLVPSVPEWRYGFSGPEMPWYPSATLYRQGAGESWADVIDRVRVRIAAGG